MRLRPQLSSFAGIFLGLAALGWAGCMQATQTYPLVAHAQTGLVGSLSVERIEGGQRLVVVELSQLPPPERIAPGLKEFAVWLEGPEGTKIKAGMLRYDRERRSGNLLATTDLTAFTVRVTGERDIHAVTPSGVLLAERRVVTN
jgi:hypothetical protein